MKIKRFISLLLTLIIALSSLPMSAFANSEDEIVNLAAGKSYAKSVAPTLTGDYMDGLRGDTDDLELTDGKIPAPDYWGDNGWVHWISAAPEVTIDLEGIKEITSFEIVTLSHFSADGFILPNNVKISVSNNNALFTEVETVYYPTASEVTTATSYSLTCTPTDSVSGRYVKFTFPMGWTLLGEIKVFGIDTDEEIEVPEPETPGVVNLAYGSNYECSSAPNSSYPDEDYRSLTDGITGEGTIYEEAWSGWAAEVNPVSITVDLGALQSFDKISVTSMEGEGGVTYPEYLIFEVSDDGKNFDEVHTGTIPDNAPSPGKYEYVYKSDAYINAQYVRITFPANVWVFISEIQIFGEETVFPDNNNILRGVKYETSLEKDDFFAGYTDVKKQRLTDGYYAKSASWTSPANVGFYEEGDFTFEFDEEKTFTEIRFDAFQNELPKVSLPTEIVIENKNANGVWVKIHEGKLERYSESKVRYIYRVPDDESLATNGIRFCIKGTDKAWVFIDEIGVYKKASRQEVNINPEIEPLSAPKFIDNLESSVLATEGETVNLSVRVQVNAGENLNFQWYKDNEKIGGNSSAFTIYNMSSADEGSYKVVVTKEKGESTVTATSNVATVKLADASEIADKPHFVKDLNMNVSADSGSDLNLYVSANVDDGGTLSYQWYYNEKPVGENSPEYFIENLAPSDAGFYKVVVTNTNGDLVNTAESTVCVLRIVDSNASVNLLNGLKYEASVLVEGSYPDSGKEITDGKKGTLDWNNASWVGSMTNISYTFDLGDTKEFEELCVNFLQLGYAAIYPAQSVKLSVSDDNEKWTVVATSGIIISNASQYIHEICCTLDKVYSGRYVKVDIVKNAGWLFIDEIELWSRAKKSAQNASNLALGAVYLTNGVSKEKPDTVPKKLTDGIISNEDYTKSGWLDFQPSANDNMIIIDLGGNKTFGQVDVRFLNDTANGIKVPSKVTFEYSDVNGQWHNLGTENISSVDETKASVYTLEHALDNSVKGKMIRITFPVTEKAYIDEIIVRKEKNIVPDGETDTEYVNENNLAYKKAYTVDADVLYGADTGLLTDGNYGGYLYNTPEWLGYDLTEQKTMTVTLDLGDVKTFEQIKAGFLKSHSISLNIDYPLIVDIEYSSDNENWQSYYWEFLLWDNESGVRRLITDGEAVSARYIRFTIESEGLVFIDEIEVFEDADIVIDTEANPDLGVMQNLVRGLEYSVSRSADHRSTPGILTNGKYAHSASLYDDNWTGFERKRDGVDNHITLIFDMLSSNSVSEIILSSMEDEAANVTTPKNIRVSVSSNNIDWMELTTIPSTNVGEGKVSLNWSASEDGFNSLDENADMLYTRCIKIEFDVPSEEGIYAFLDEIKIIGKKGKCSTASIPGDESGAYNVALHKPYTYGDIGPTPTMPDIGGVQLTDGIRGIEDETDPAWVGFWRGDLPNGTMGSARYLRTIIIDLEGTKSVTSVQTTLLAGLTSVQPWGVHIYASMDGVNWTYLARTACVDMWTKGNYGHSWRGITNIGFARRDFIDPEIEAVAANYIRVDIESLHHNLLDEIEVMGYDGIIEGALIPEGGRDLDNGRDFLQAGEETLGAQDIYLCYNGWYGYDEVKQDYTGDWSASEYRPILTYLDNEGNVVDTFMDTVLFLGLGSRMGRGFLHDGITEETKFEDWEWYIEKTFREGGDVDELNKAAHIAAEELGDPDYEVNCLIMYPTTYYWDRDFGPVNGEYLDLNTADGWTKAARWWYTEVIKRFEEGNYDKVNFIGFYWLDEQVGFVPEMVIDGINEAHKLGYKMFWIPMPAANGLLWSEDVGFDVVALQPGHFFSDAYSPDSNGQIGNGHVENMIRHAQYGNLGLEVELDDRYFTRVDFYNKGLDYFNAFAELGVSGPGPLRAWYDGSFSLTHAAYRTEPHIRAFYDYAYQLTQGTYTHKDYIESFGDVQWEGYKGKEYSGNAAYGGMGGTGGAGGGAYYKPETEIVETATPVGDDYKWVTATNGYKLKGKDGNFVKGWVSVENNWYYLDSDGYMKTGWVKDSDIWYYLKDNGVMVSSGWYKVQNTWYYFGGNGAMKTGWIFDDGKWYYLHDHGGMANTEWVEVKGRWYYFGGNGSMKNGWIKYLNDWYYLDNDGAMVTGWKLIENEWYYFVPDNGKMAYNTTVEGFRLSSSGALV